MFYIKNKPSGLNAQEIVNKIEKIIGKHKKIGVLIQNNEIIELEIDDKGLSVSKNKELQEYVDTLKE